MRRKQHLPDADITDCSGSVGQNTHAETGRANRAFLLHGMTSLGSGIVKIHQIGLHRVNKDDIVRLWGFDPHWNWLVYTTIQAHKKEEQYGG